MTEEETPQHIVDYMTCVEIIARWCINREKIGDGASIPILAYTFADNVINLAQKINSGKTSNGGHTNSIQ